MNKKSESSINKITSEIKPKQMKQNKNKSESLECEYVRQPSGRTINKSYADTVLGLHITSESIYDNARRGSLEHQRAGSFDPKYNTKLGDIELKMKEGSSGNQFVDLSMFHKIVEDNIYR